MKEDERATLIFSIWPFLQFSFITDEATRTLTKYFPHKRKSYELHMLLYIDDGNVPSNVGNALTVCTQAKSSWSMLVFIDTVAMDLKHRLSNGGFVRKRNADESIRNKLKF